MTFLHRLLVLFLVFSLKTCFSCDLLQIEDIQITVSGSEMIDMPDVYTILDKLSKNDSVNRYLVALLLGSQRKTRAEVAHVIFHECLTDRIGKPTNAATLTESYQVPNPEDDIRVKMVLELLKQRK